ncbi:laccase-14 [Lucilia cuprina]|uniref:laccase-14 n=1 Tax=Lucilia cuprina TaxID=7375 RepID=UPI001F0549A5|nr:laccase-14 [Lucilia cuprina]
MKWTFLLIFLQIFVIKSEILRNEEKLQDEFENSEFFDYLRELELKNNLDNEEVVKKELPIGYENFNISRVYWGFSNPFSSKNNKSNGPQNYLLNDNFNADDISYGSFDRHPCRRVCKQGESLSCYYRLVVHNYQTLGPECQRCMYDPSVCEQEQCVYGDGVATGVMAVNRQVPGPSMEVCENDTIIVDVLNYLSEAFTMHWHGLRMTQTPESDGAPYITQYPVQPAEVYRYSFPAERSGTVWYHSQMGWQRSLGVAGSFVIRQTKQNNRHANLYDFDLIEHTLLIQDTIYNYDYMRPRNILINGKGRNHLNNWPDNDSRNRYERLRVSPNMRYRMRVIANGVFNCPLEFSIENHKMLMISTDGNDIEPIYADKFFMSSGERFDFVLEANQYPGNYWIKVKGYNDCANYSLYQGAILHYRGSSRNKAPLLQMSEATYGRQGPAENQIHVNTLAEFYSLDTKDSSYLKANEIPTAGLRSLNPLPWPSYTKFQTFYSSFGMRRSANTEDLFQIDDITFASPQVSLLQGRNLYYEDNFYCNRTAFQQAGRNCQYNNCQCTNVLRIPAFRPIELVVANYLDTTLPFHTHGYTYRLVGQAVLGNVNDLRRIQDLDRRGLLQRTPNDFPAVEKDSIQIPGLGYIILRFISDNPGFWMYHCHLERHTLMGMSAVLKVGENQQIKKLPPKLRC